MFNLLLPIIITGVSIGLFFLQTRPILWRISLVETTREALNSAKKSSEQYQDLLKQKNREFNTVDDSKKRFLNKLLPDSIDNVKLIIDINQIASAHGMTIRNISIKGGDSNSIGPDSRAYGVVALGFSVSGPYKVFKEFVDDLEKSLRLIDITSLSFTSGDKDQYEYNLEVNAYWLK